MDVDLEFKHDRLRSFLEIIVKQCARPVYEFEGGYVQKNDHIKDIAEAALAPIPMSAGKL